MSRINLELRTIIPLAGIAALALTGGCKTLSADSHEEYDTPQWGTSHYIQNGYGPLRLEVPLYKFK
jgi:hypothetical protein